MHQDGSKRLLGRYRDAAFSPHGRFIAATRANQRSRSTRRATFAGRSRGPAPASRPGPGPRTDTRIAYLSGGRLRIVAGDGTGDRAVGRAALVAPAWRPGPSRVLAFAANPKSVVGDEHRRRNDRPVDDQHGRGGGQPAQHHP